METKANRKRHEHIPLGWRITDLADCVDILDSQRIPVNLEERKRRPGNVPYYGATGQVGWINDFLFDEQLLLLGEDGAPFFDKSKPISYVIYGKTWVNNHAHVLRSLASVTSNSFLKWYLDLFDFTGYVTGTTRLKLTQSSMKSIPVLLPPPKEQHRIVAKLEQLLAKVYKCKERLERIPSILKRFRQSVLAAACSGGLTRDWRQKNRGIAPAADLIRELRTPIPAPHLGVYESTSGAVLPPNWVWAPLGRLGEIIGGGTPSTANPAFWDGEIPWVSPKDMKSDAINDSIDHITAEGLSSSSTKVVPKGSILFVIRGMILNHTLPVAITARPVSINQDIKALIPEVPQMGSYLFLAAKHLANHILFAVKEATHGTRRIETQVLKNWAFPIPPMDEQQEIVRRVEALFKIADQIEARYKKAKAQVDRLTQSILARAFRGELVPQDQNDEPASELLKRIREEREKWSAKGRER